ncbi:sodium:alanine symporter family protein, partial [Bacillus sp. JJ664]
VLVNLYAITRLSKVAKALLLDYIAQKKKGVDPVFHADSISDLPGREHLEAWVDEKEANKQIG